MTLFGEVTELKQQASSSALIETTTTSSSGSFDDLKEEADSSSPQEQQPKQKNYQHGGELVLVNNDLKEALVLENVCYRKKKKQILSNISCAIPAGQLTMIIGASGGGKSSLLDLISKRVNHKKECSGSISFKGKPLTKKLFHKQGGYVFQDDILLATDTIHEILMESSLLKYKHESGNALKDIWKTCRERTFKVENDMGLYAHRNVKIGNEQNKGASGGQKKRTSLSIQLINNPDLLLLDEYSSGLDSFTAFEIGKKLRSLAHDQGKTIVATVHQPSSALFALFDNVVVLAKGKLIYCGPVSQVKGYLNKIGYPIPEDTNPADFLISLVSNPYLKQEESANSNSASKLHLLEKSDSSIEVCIDDGIDKTKEQLASELDVVHNRIDWLSTFYQSIYSPITSTNTLNDSKDDEKRPLSSYVLESILKLLVLIYRNLRTTFRDPMIVLSELFQSVFLGLFCGLLYFRLLDDQQGITDRISAIFFAVAAISFVPAASVVATFPQQRTLFTRERESNLYGTFTYYTAYTVVHTPVEAIFPVVNLICLYWLVGFQNNPGNFFIFAAIMIIVQWLSESIGLFIGALCESVDVGNLVLSVVMTVWMCFGGFLIRNTQIGWWFYPFSYTSLFRYSVHALAQNELDRMNFGCASSTKALTNFNMTDICSFRNGSSINFGNETIPIESYSEQLCSEMNWNQTISSLTSAACFKTGNEALIYYFDGSNHIPIWGNVIILLGMFFIMRIGIYLALRFRKYGRK